MYSERRKLKHKRKPKKKHSLIFGKANGYAKIAVTYTRRLNAPDYTSKSRHLVSAVHNALDLVAVTPKRLVTVSERLLTEVTDRSYYFLLVVSSLRLPSQSGLLIIFKPLQSGDTSQRGGRRKTSGGGGGGVGGEPVEHPTAAEAVEQMGIGINIGNRYDLPKAHPVNKGTDAPDYDAKSHIDFIKEGGFKHVRIPVTWGMHFWERPNQLKRVTEAVEHALNQGLWVMINTHHEFWLKDQYNGQTWLDDKFRELWSKIADHFKASSNKLVFEVLNEPEHNFGGNPPHCTPGEVCHDQVFAHDQQAIDRTRRINQVGYEAIRSVSKTRVVFVSPNSQGNHALLRTVYPKKADLPSGGSDKQLAVTVHSYDPWDCCGPEGDNSKCSASKDQGWKGMPDFDDLQKWSKNEGIPLHLGEYGVGRSFDSGKDHQRGEKIVNDVYWKVTRDALQRGISACAWDDHGDFATADGRYKNNEWQHNIKDVIMDAVKNAGK